MKEILDKIEELLSKVSQARKILKLDEQQHILDRKREEMNQQDFWQDSQRAVAISKEVQDIESDINFWSEVSSELIGFKELALLSEKEEDVSILKDLNKKLNILEEKIAKQERLFLFSGKFDKDNAIISVHSGSGGVDAQDWAEILERMFLRFADKNNWKTEILDRNLANEAGIKSVDIRVIGRYAYGNLKGEGGVHRLVRISPFDAEGMRHTSFALVEVIPELEEVEDVELKEEDLRIDVYRSSGPGGQSVNTTDSAVRVVHKPTNISVSCQSERSQHQNKEMAIKVLKSKLYKLEEEKREEQEQKLKGDIKKAEWGKQIRSYVMQPYKMVKDHRTGHETADIENVLDGNLASFAEEYLKWLKK